MTRLLTLAALAAVLLALGGVPAARAGEPKVSVTDARATTIADAIKSNKGKVVLIDCWATWCVPCVKRFPHLVESHKKYGEKGLVCMSLSMDKAGDEDDYKPEKVLNFLKEKGATFPNFVLAEPRKDEEALTKLIGDYTAIPYLVMFDRSGRRVWTSDKKLTNDELDKLIEEQLAEKR